MDDNKIIQILLVVIVILLLIIGVMFLTSSKKEDSKICITSNPTLKEGDSITVKLTDLNNTPIKEGIVEIELLDESGSVISSDSGKMDSEGECQFDLNLSDNVFKTLVNTTEGNLDKLHRYYELKKQTRNHRKIRCKCKRHWFYRSSSCFINSKNQRFNRTLKNTQKRPPQQTWFIKNGRSETWYA